MTARWGQRGHTLLELMIVISILSVMLAAVLPVLGRVYQHYELEGSSREIVSDIRSAQVSAWVEHGEQELRFNRFSPRYSRWESGVFRWQKRMSERIAYRLGYIESTVETLRYGRQRAVGSGNIRLINQLGQQAEVKIFPISGHAVFGGMR
ncbi:pilus assembly FimT family protein [Tumebacillus lipolyticus]|uniref:Tfp pilus assembly protein FimT/FimU n=1 Tax=Tumebacillus lipolyticus TaxID=1280370 RepID=A0ABW4ZTY3_9BACL